MKRISIAVAAAVAFGASGAHAWEAETTNAGLTSNAAFAAGLHGWLTDTFGLEHGMYERLRLPEAEAPKLHGALGRLDPVLGSVPDGKQRLPALEWLVAGAIAEEIPGERGRHHFFGKDGLSYSPGFLRSMWWRAAGVSPPGRGMAAPDWILSKDNELGMTTFLDALEKAATGATRAERDAHLARALAAAGAMLAVLEDMGSPSRAHGDFDAHLMPLGGGALDRGSRLERLAAAGYGRLDVPVAVKIETRTRARDFFTSKDGTGLADVTARSWYSYGTLPEEVRLPSGPLRPMTVAKQPLDFAQAATPEGAALRNPNGTCVAVYRKRGRRLDWIMPDDCVRDQLREILPRTGAYATGFLAWLLRGSLSVGADGVSLATLDVTEGTLRFYSEDAEGARAPLGSPLTIGKVAGGQPLGAVPSAPESASRLVAVFRGVDGFGEPLVAVGFRSLREAPRTAEPPPPEEPEIPEAPLDPLPEDGVPPEPGGPRPGRR